MKKQTAKRYNKGKLRYELLPTHALKSVVEVYTKGAHKYSVYKDTDGNLIKGSEIPFEEVSNRNLELIEDGANNWRLGQNWMGSIASVERHIEEWKQGIDFDKDPSMGTYHLANAAWGLLSILEYYKIYPQGDDRPHKYLNEPKIGLDIDEVLCDWVGDWTKYRELPTPESWSFDRGLIQEFEKMKSEGRLDEFYLSLHPLIQPSDIPFEPHCYITSRPVDTKITEEWLAKHGFPARPVFTTTSERTKAAIAKEQGLDIFVDDGYHNFVELNKAGICTFLMDAPHNQRYDVGFKRIKELKEIV